MTPQEPSSPTNNRTSKLEEANDEEEDTKENCDRRNNLDKVVHFPSNRGLVGLRHGGEAGDATNEGPVTGATR